MGKGFIVVVDLHVVFIKDFKKKPQIDNIIDAEWLIDSTSIKGNLWGKLGD